MQLLSADQLKAICGGSTTTEPTTTQGPNGPVYSCPTGTFPAQLPDGTIVCTKPS